MNENELLTNGKLREELVEHYEVLEKVKQLLLIPGTEFATTSEVANFYEVTTDAIQKVYQRNKEEVDMDGITVISAKSLIGTECPISKDIRKDKYSTTFEYENGINITIPNRGIKVFPRRAILRVGMLLRDSKVAKEVRTQLLNVEEKTTKEVKVQDINEEQKLALELGMAMASGDMNAIAIATGNMMAFKNRHIEKLKTDNKALAEGNLEWSNRSKLNAGMRKLSQTIGKQYGAVWNELYYNLKYKYHIDLKARGNKNFIQYIKEEEWIYVIKTFAALCEDYGYSSSDMIDCKVKRTYSK